MTLKQFADHLVDKGLPVLLDEHGKLSPLFIDAIVAAIENFDSKLLEALTAGLFKSDLGDVLSVLEEEQRLQLVALLGNKFDFSSLAEIDESVKLPLMTVLAPEVVAEGIMGLDTDNIVYILEGVQEDEQSKILALIPRPKHDDIKKALRYPEQSAGRLMQTTMVAIPSFWTVAQTVEYCRNDAHIPEEFYSIYVTDADSKLYGTVTLCQLLKTPAWVSIKSITNDSLHMIEAYEDREEAAYIFRHYSLISLPVVDQHKRLLGVIMADDIIDVVQEEVDEDLRALVGLGDEEISASVIDITRGRFVWLTVNLLTAFLSAAVISFFEAVIKEVVALAVLAPIVTSQGGNAATQTMTVAVRSIATRELSWFNLGKFITREALVGLLNGTLFAILIGTTVWFLYSNAELSVAVSSAIIINLLVGALAGALFPLAVYKLNGDPAVVSGTFVTTVTDCVGFLAVLGIAALLFAA